MVLKKWVYKAHATSACSWIFPFVVWDVWSRRFLQRNFHSNSPLFLRRCSLPEPRPPANWSSGGTMTRGTMWPWNSKAMILGSVIASSIRNMTMSSTPTISGAYRSWATSKLGFGLCPDSCRIPNALTSSLECPFALPTPLEPMMFASTMLLWKGFVPLLCTSPIVWVWVHRRFFLFETLAS